jgi:hypothetical protein
VVLVKEGFLFLIIKHGETRRMRGGRRVGRDVECFELHVIVILSAPCTKWPKGSLVEKQVLQRYFPY